MVSRFSCLLYLPAAGRIVHKLESFQAKHQYYKEAVNLNVNKSPNYLHPSSLTIQTAGNNMFNFHQAMKQPNRMVFTKAMESEIKAHTDNNHFEFVHRNLIGKTQTIKAIWSFERKRRSDGSLLKQKAQSCTCSSMHMYREI